MVLIMTIHMVNTIDVFEGRISLIDWQRGRPHEKRGVQLSIRPPTSFRSSQSSHRGSVIVDVDCTVVSRIELTHHPISRFLFHIRSLACHLHGDDGVTHDILFWSEQQ